MPSLVAPWPISGLKTGTTSMVALPARIDLAGGWTDTPPWCLNNQLLLNMAVYLDGKPVLTAEAEALAEPVWRLSDDQGQQRAIDQSTLDQMASIPSQITVGAWRWPACIALASSMMLARSAKASPHTPVLPSWFGLGASSVLAGAVMQALQQLASRDTSADTVGPLVLAVESRMGSGGGWQDQYGGLLPGVKLVRSQPTLPLRIQGETLPLAAETAEALRQRLVLVFTGQERPRTCRKWSAACTAMTTICRYHAWPQWLGRGRSCRLGPR